MIFPRLAEELAWLRAALSQEAKDEPKADKAIGAVGTAENVAKQMELALYQSLDARSILAIVSRICAI